MQIAVNELLPPDLQCTDAIDGWKTRLRLLHQADAKLRHADALAAWARDRKPAHD